MKVAVETITPQLAATWLEANTSNRKLKNPRVEQLAAAIRRGEWEENGESIKFNGTALIDGQHRLAAVVAAGMPVRSLVIRDLPTSAQDTVDTGVRRSLADILQIRGEDSANVLASALNNLFIWRSSGSLRAAMVNKYPTHQQALRLLSDNPGIRNSLTWGNQARHAVRASAGLATFMHFIFSEIDREDADDFFTKFVTGAGLEADSPILLLRRLHTGDGSGKSTNPRTRVFVMGALFIKAWNAYRTGEPVLRLRYKAGGKTPDKFPVPA